MAVRIPGETYRPSSTRSRLTGHAALCILSTTLLLCAPDAVACTIGVFGSSVTSDGRPILWKNRDNDCPDQAIAIFSGPSFRFVTNIDIGNKKEAWAGVNE